MKNNKKARQKNIFRFYIDFYKRFPIPWWLFIMNTTFGIIYAEITMRLANYSIAINKGQLFNSVILGYVLLTVLNSLVAYVRELFYNYGSLRIILRAKSVLWRRLLHLPAKEIEIQQPSRLVSAVVNDAASASQAIGYLFLSAASIYGFVRACVTLRGYNAELANYVLLVIPVAIVEFYIIGKMQFTINLKQRKSLNEMVAFFSEHLSAAKYVKAYALEAKEIESGFQAINRRYYADIYSAFMSNVQVLINSIYSKLTTIIIAFGGSRLIEAKRMESTGINSFSSYMDKVNQYLAELLGHYTTYKGMVATLGRMNELLELPVEEPEKGEEWKEEGNGDIVFDDVTFGYREDAEILHGVSFRIPAKKRTAIIGDNGCGKSTILKLMQGLYMPNAGNISVAGNLVGEVRLSELRKKFGYVLQSNDVFAGTLRDNITYGLDREISEEEILSAAESACLDTFIETLPDGYDTMIGESGSQLSGGQRQRLAIARALIQNPDYLLMDEAGSSLDYHTYNAICGSVERRMAEKTVIFIAHDMREIMTADYVIVLNQGHVEATGTHEQLLATSATYQDYMSRASA